MSRFILLLLVLFIFACEKDEELTLPAPIDIPPLSAVGTATGVPVDTVFPGLDIPVKGTGFTLDFTDDETGEKLGAVTDVNLTMTPRDDGSVLAENYTVFTFAEDGSTLILHFLIDMVPLSPTTMDVSANKDLVEYNVAGGTGRFSGVGGRAALQATLDVTEMAAGTIGFECIYDIRLEP